MSLKETQHPARHADSFQKWCLIDSRFRFRMSRKSDSAILSLLVLLPIWDRVLSRRSPGAPNGPTAGETFPDSDLRYYPPSPPSKREGKRSVSPERSAGGPHSVPPSPLIVGYYIKRRCPGLRDLIPALRRGISRGGAVSRPLAGDAKPRQHICPKRFLVL
jgi:hypothetical protein